MAYWDTKQADADNLRLFYPTVGWKRYRSSADDEGRIVFSGCSSDVQAALSGALNASNLILLTGAGSSFCATNPGDLLQAPGMTDLWNAVEARVSEAGIKQIVDLIPKASGINKNIEKLMSLAKIYVALFDDDNSKVVSRFIEGAEQAIHERVDFVTTNTELGSHRAMIRKLARRGIRKPRTKIFTTNYDLCYEYAGQSQRFVVVDGFSHSQPPTYDQAHFSYDTVRRGGKLDAPDYIENVFHLYKLHGSIDWRRLSGRVTRDKTSKNGEPVLIYPRDTKYQEAFEPPYLDMMSAFQSSLREPDTALIVSGFGFNDDHLSKPILSALEANLSLKLIICDVAFVSDDSLKDEPDLISPDAVPRVRNQYFDQFRRLAELGDSRITLLSGRFEDLSHALPDLASRTEREAHVERFRTLVDGAESRT